jgi:hypothetical protein
MIIVWCCSLVPVASVNVALIESRKSNVVQHFASVDICNKQDVEYLN